jgi:hypothetical protein
MSEGRSRRSLIGAIGGMSGSGSWKEIEWESSPVRLPAVDRYLERVSNTHVNGGYLWGRWESAYVPDLTSWFTARNRFEEYELPRVLFDSAVVREDLRELQIPDEGVASQAN